MRHRITLTEEEIEILLGALESADFYPPEEYREEFFRELANLRRKLQRVLDYDYVRKRRIAGLIGNEQRRRKERERNFEEFKEILKEINVGQ